MKINKESDLKKIVEDLGDLSLGKMDINGRKAFILGKNDSEVVVLEKYLGNGLQKVKYCFSDSNEPLRPKGKPEIIYEFHKNFDELRALYDERIYSFH